MKKLDHDLSKYITTQEFNNSTAHNFCSEIRHANLATIAVIADFVKETDFNNKLKNLNKKVTSNKTKHVETEENLIDLTKKVCTSIRKRICFFVRLNVFYRR